MDGKTAFLHQLLEGCAPAAVRSIRDGYHALERLPYRRIWAVDLEFATNGDPTSHMVLLRSGTATGPSSSVVAFGRKIACWQQLGWLNS